MAAFGGNLNIGVIKGAEKKFTGAVALGDSFNWTAIGFTPDSKRVAVALLKEDELRYYSLDARFLGAVREVAPLRVSRSFKWALDSHEEDGAEKNVLGLISGERFSPKFVLPADLEHAELSPDDKLAAFSIYRPAKDGKKGISALQLLSLKTGKYLKKYSPELFGPIGHVRFSPDGGSLAFADSDGQVRLVRLSDWKFTGSVSKRGKLVFAMDFSPDGSMLAVGYGEGLRVYSLPDLRVIIDRDFTGTLDTDWNINDVAFAKDGSFVAVLVWTKAADGHSVKFIDIKRR
ncbi:MAG: hypothetical protein A2X32_01515 [Elusimicrobia bacterium GWC2_64_44]|nr:MAG: hypothetical protein A2X32_01515 [Elusimicrobia bacterium GWC2_64_44]